MTHPLIPLGFLAALTACATSPTNPGPDDVIATLAPAALPMDGYGGYHRAIQDATGEAQRWFDQALQLVYGLERKTEAIDDGVFDRRRWQNGAFAEYQGSFFEQLFVTVGARYDDNEDFGGHTSARVSGAYLFALGGGEAKLRGAYGTGFRAPSLYEIAYNQSDWAYPPASATTLSEERSRGFDVGLGWRGAGGAESALFLK